jgi:chromosome segregation ATPase
VSADTLVTVFGIVLTTAVALAAFVTATRANRVQAQSAVLAVDAQAYERARDSYEAALRVAHGELAGLRAEMVTVRGELAATRVSNEQLQQAVRELRAQLAG